MFNMSPVESCDAAGEFRYEFLAARDFDDPVKEVSFNYSVNLRICELSPACERRRRYAPRGRDIKWVRLFWSDRQAARGMTALA